ncbi:MAG: hypothetical protein GY807_22850 [Gammaproteobacteria bacterium]|nr:hypothetical protein [Gammaproteobacteria bacterium]
MPLLSIETNQSLSGDALKGVIESASALVANALGKSEKYVMVRFSHNDDMCFSGSHRALAYLQLKSIGLAKETTAELSSVLCEFVESRLEVPKNRIYIEFVDAPRKMWGFDGRTF